MRVRASVAAAVAAAALATGMLAGCSDSDKEAKVAQGPVAGVPEVTANATNLDKEPKVEAGKGDAPADLRTRDLVIGSGDVAKTGDTVNVRYVGSLYPTGDVFDASWKQGSDPVSFSLSEVVPGFAQGITGMKSGGRREIVIPPKLGYGPTASGPIPGNSTLVFVVDLVKTGA